ncbi:MAG TPA: GNAT family N-acetyltransferase [Nocardioides sp.]
MSRTAATLRGATTDDAAALVGLWSDLLRRGTPSDLLEEMKEVIGRIAKNPAEQIVIADCDGAVAGAVILRTSPLTPFNSEVAVQAISPHVAPAFRRRGIGHQLMEAAVQHAEEQGVGHVAAASLSNSRDAHRFLARMALAPQAVLRIAPTHVVRTKLSGRRPTSAPHRQPLGQVLAQRRSLRRQRDTA